MMSAIMIFDVFQYIKSLQKLGLTEEQIEAQVSFTKIQAEMQNDEFTKDQVKVVQQQVDTINHTIDNDLATKQDIERLDLKIGVIGNESLTKQDIKELDHKVGVLDHKVEALDHKIGALDHKVETLDFKIEVFRKELKADIAQMGYKLAGILGSVITIGIAVLGFLIELH